jgi:hypothetical protein
MKKIALLFILASFLVATPAMAKEGFYLGLNLVFNDLSGDINPNDYIDSGNGLGLRGGFGLNRYLAIEGGLWKTTHDTKGSETVDLSAGTIDLKLSLPLSGSSVAPYILGGLGSYTLKGSGGSIDGRGGQLGIGMDIYLFPELNFNVGLTRRNVTFDDHGTDRDGKITSLDFGFSYHFI